MQAAKDGGRAAGAGRRWWIATSGKLGGAVRGNAADSRAGSNIVGKMVVAGEAGKSVMSSAAKRTHTCAASPGMVSGRRGRILQ